MYVGVYTIQSTRYDTHTHTRRNAHVSACQRVDCARACACVYLASDACACVHVCVCVTVVASEKGVVVGRLTFTEDGDLIDCTRMGVGGKAIPPNIDKVREANRHPHTHTHTHTRARASRTHTGVARAVPLPNPLSTTLCAAA